MLVTQSDISAGIRTLGLCGQVVCVHSSLKSFGVVDGGADTVIAAFLDLDCTMMVPAHWDGRRTGPRPQQHYRRNGTSESYYHGLAAASPPAPLDPYAIDPDMGAIPAAVLRWKGSWRGKHLTLSFAAVGPQAQALVGSQSVHAPDQPMETLIACGGTLLMIGVGLNSLTALHYAEVQAGRIPFRRWLIDERGEQVEFTSGGCSGGFQRLAPALAGLEHSTQVGASLWRCLPAGPAIHAAATAIRADPAITHCGNPRCERCRDAILGGFLA